MSYTDQLLGTIDARIAEAHEQMASLEGALEALQTRVPAPTVVTGELSPERVARRVRARAAQPAGSKKATVKRVPRAKLRKLDADGLTALLEPETDGLSAASIAERGTAAYNQVLELLHEREQAGEVRRTGTRRSSLWRLITDEERIAARAAELAAR